jgi:hypothetical protein
MVSTVTPARGDGSSGSNRRRGRRDGHRVRHAAGEPERGAESAQLRQFNAGTLRDTLAQIGITELYASNRVTAGSPLLVASGQVGEFRVEEPLATESWREQAKQKTWWQSSVRPVAYVTNAFAIVQINGVA